MYPWLAIDHDPTPRRQIKRMPAGKTISLYLESRERSLPVLQAEEPFEPAILSTLPGSFYTPATEWKLTVYRVLIMSSDSRVTLRFDSVPSGSSSD